MCICESQYIGTAEVVARSNLDGDIEHMQKKYILENDTQLRKKLVYVRRQQKFAMWQKNKGAVECAIEKDSRLEKPRNCRCIKNAQRRKIARK